MRSQWPLTYYRSALVASAATSAALCGVLAARVLNDVAPGLHFSNLGLIAAVALSLGVFNAAGRAMKSVSLERSFQWLIQDGATPVRAVRSTGRSVPQENAGAVPGSTTENAGSLRESQPGTARKERTLPETGDVSSTSDLDAAAMMRTQLLVDHQVRVIDSLVRDESDPTKLETLLALDAVTTRLRRRTESWLVLADYEATRSRAGSVSIDDLVRVAIGEVGDPSRVDADSLDTASTRGDASIRGDAAADLAHLLAELLSNGIQHGRADDEEPVGITVIAGSPAGQCEIIVADHGPGMTAEQRARAEEYIVRPPLSPSGLTGLGLAVVGKIAARTGCEVQFSETEGGGCTVHVGVPAALLVNDPVEPSVSASKLGGAVLGGAVLEASALVQEAPMAVIARSRPRLHAREEGLRLPSSWVPDQLPQAAAPTKLKHILPTGDVFEAALRNLLQRDAGRDGNLGAAAEAGTQADTGTESSDPD